MPKSSPIDELHYAVFGRKPGAGERRRAEILETVIRIIAREGVDELTFEKIGKRAGMARSHVVYYFPNREALVVAAIRFAALSADRTIKEALGGGTDWRDKLHRYTEGNFNWMQTCPEHATVYALLYYLASFKPKYRALHTEIRDIGADRIEGILGEGSLGSGAKRRTLAKRIQALVTGVIVDVMTTNVKSPKERLAETQRGIDILVENA